MNDLNLAINTCIRLNQGSVEKYVVFECGCETGTYDFALVSQVENLKKEGKKIVYPEQYAN